MLSVVLWSFYGDIPLTSATETTKLQTGDGVGVYNVESDHVRNNPL